jgi:hypothetical protein
MTSTDYPPPAATAPNTVLVAPVPYRATAVLPFLAALVFVFGVAGSVLLGFCWPIMRFDSMMDLNSVVTKPMADDTVFNVPLFMIGAGPSMITAAVLYVGGSIIDELRRTRASQSVTTAG